MTDSPFRCDTCAGDQVLSYDFGKAPRTAPCQCGGTLYRVFKPQLIRGPRAIHQ